MNKAADAPQVFVPRPGVRIVSTSRKSLVYEDDGRAVVIACEPGHDAERQEDGLIIFTSCCQQWRDGSPLGATDKERILGDLRQSLEAFGMWLDVV